MPFLFWGIWAIVPLASARAWPLVLQNCCSDNCCFVCSRIEQYKALFLRYFKAYWRSPPYNTTRLILALTGDVTNVLGALFISVMFVGFINFQMIIPTFFMERPVMYRERAARMYAVLPWVQSMEDVEIPWILGQARSLGSCCYSCCSCCCCCCCWLRLSFVCCGVSWKWYSVEPLACGSCRRSWRCSSSAVRSCVPGPPYLQLDTAA
jgi:hypothetical protein